MDKASQRNLLEDDSGFGLLIFCSSIPSLNSFFPIVDIEFDIRGDFAEKGSKNCSIICGEIKSSWACVDKAKKQLHKRLTILKEAAVCLQWDNIELEGWIFLPIEEASKDMPIRESQGYRVVVKYM